MDIQNCRRRQDEDGWKTFQNQYLFSINFLLSMYPAWQQPVSTGYGRA